MGQMASRERFRRDAGKTSQKTGHPGKNGTSGNPTVKREERAVEGLAAAGLTVHNGMNLVV